MCKKIDKISYKINLILKLKNKYDRYKLITSVIKHEHFIYYIQSMQNYPEYDDDGNILNNENNEFEWINKLNELFNYIKNNLFDFPINQTIKDLII